MKTYDSLAEYNADVAAARAAYAADQRVEAGQSERFCADSIPQQAIEASAQVTIPGPSEITGRLAEVMPMPNIGRVVLVLVVGSARAIFQLDAHKPVEIHL